MNVFEYVPPKPSIPEDLKAAVGDLVGARRRKVYSVTGELVCKEVKQYLMRIAPQNHKTADSFTPAATPTGHLEKAARNTVFSANADGAKVTITSPGITRAFHDLDIRAKRKMLTIPARTAPEAYGRTASQVSTTERLFLVKTKSGGAFLATGDESKKSLSGRGKRPPRPQRVRPRKPDREYPTAGVPGVRPVFWLRASVHVPQKRDILPSDRAITAAAVRGMSRGVRAVLEENGVPVK